MLKNPIVKIDVDGVIRDVPSKIIEIYNRHFPENEKTLSDFTEYDVDKMFPEFEEKFGITANNFLFGEYGRHISRKSSIYSDVKEAFDMLVNKNAEVFICTHQHTNSNKIGTINWLKEHNLTYDDICFTKNKSLVKSDFFIDDKWKNILNEVFDNPNTMCILIEQPYNKKAVESIKTGMYGKAIQVAANLKEAVEIILKYS